MINKKRQINGLYRSIDKQLESYPIKGKSHGDCSESRQNKLELKAGLAAQLKRGDKSFREMTIRNDLWRNSYSMSRVMRDANYSYNGRPLQFPKRRIMRFDDLALRHKTIQNSTIQLYQRKYNLRDEKR